MPNRSFDLINVLDSFSSPTLDDIHGALFSQQDVLGQLRDWIESLPHSDLYEMNKVNRVDDVQPTNFVLCSRAGRFEVVINHFDSKKYAKSKNAPHFHHCDFSTRILCGGYVHAVYDNTTTETDVQLSVRNITTLTEGEGYQIAWQTYHTILRPVNNTLTLLVRGPQRHGRPNLSEKPYPMSAFAAEFAAMCAVLGQAADACALQSS